MLHSRAVSIGVRPLHSSSLVEAPCFKSNLITLVLFFRAASCITVEWNWLLHWSTSAPPCNKTGETSVLLECASLHSAMIPYLSALSAGTPASSSSISKLGSPTRAARVKLKISSSSVSKKKMEITIKQLDFCEAHFIIHSLKSCNFVQTLMKVTTKLLHVDIKLLVHNNSRLF